MSEDLGFGGEIPGFYHRYRRCYPPPVINRLVDVFGLAGDDVAIDLGCGTGQLTLPIARRVRAAVGMDPEPGMLARARQAASEQDVQNVTWVLGADTDIPAVASLADGNQVEAVTVGQALHWMRYRDLFHALIPVFRPGGGIAVVTNGTPMWLQDSSWSRALRGFLEDWFGTALTATCGTDDASRQRYRDAMTDAGFSVTEIIHSYTDELDLDRIVGGIYSALGTQKLPPPEDRADFAAAIGRAVAPHAPFIEHVPVHILAGRAL